MRRLVGDPWFYPVLFAASGIFFAVWGTVNRNLAVIASSLVLLYFVLRFLRATRVRSRPLAGGAAHVAAGGVVVFWRPGCQYCMTLIKALTPAERAAASWVNIWTDAEAAAALRRLHARREGREHEAVPTVWARKKDFIVADDASRARLKDMLRAATPAQEGSAR